jgi:predicted AlkP superfamily pyrophosphatase or phosphodiesterase
MIKYFCLTGLLLLVISGSAQDTTQHVIPGRRNSPEQQKRPYVIMISVDGMRYDYAEKYQAKHLLALSGQGVRAESMIPSFPSLTFPNHYSLVTGMYPSHHGVINNNFYDAGRKEFYSMKDPKKVSDSTWYGGTPLWVLAEQQQMLTASLYWVGSEAPIKTVYPTYYYSYNEKIPIQERIQAVVNWLSLPEETRPHLITVYFPEVDHAGHDFGPDAPETERQVHFIDSAVNAMNEAVKKTGLDVSFVLVSDHGMTNIDREHFISPYSVADTSKFIISGSEVMLQLFAKDKRDIEPAYKSLKAKSNSDFDVYLKSEMPRHLHYGTKDDRMNRIGDILLLSRSPRVFSYKKPKPGMHGFDPYKVKDMHATFIAWGPPFKKDIVIAPFENVNVYPLITQILGLPYTEKIDGKKKALKKILVKRRSFMEQKE